jgi:hypothetical protein
MTLRQRVNFQSGVASGVINNTGQTTITGTSWPVPSGGYTIPITLNPGYFGLSTQQEIIYITAVSSVSGGTNNVATVVRAQEGTSAIGTVSGTNFPWVSGPIASDFDVSNLTSTGTLTLNSGLTVNGSTTLGNGLTVQNNAAVNGTLTANTINSNADTNTYSLTTGSLTVNGLSTVLTPPVGDNSAQIASTAFVSTAVASGTNTFTNSLAGSLIYTSSLPLMYLTISGFNKYLITADLTVGNNDYNNGHFVYFQINNATASTSSQVMSTYVPSGQRGYIGNSYIVTGEGTGAQSIAFMGYIGGSTVGSVVTLTANAIGLT